jgi:predicted 2-oxoglutarate/Fe(II)-dependent dioxygenase YbiX
MRTTAAPPDVLDDRHCISTVADVLSAGECAALVAFAEERGFVEAPLTTEWGFVRAPEIRNNGRAIVDDPRGAAALWARVAHAVPAARHGARVVGLNERLRFYRYEAGQFFRWHRDGAFARSPAERSHLTLVVYLNDDFEGGATEFEGGPVVRPKRGSALVFAHPVLHQGASVERGRKYVSRTDVMYRRA